jgi:hypothetical protein
VCLQDKYLVKILKSSINEFSWAQMTSNTDGKTSASGTMGVVVCLVGCLTFFMGAVSTVFFKGDGELLVQSIMLIYAGAALLGYRKSKADEAPGEAPGDLVKKAKKTQKNLSVEEDNGEDDSDAV